MVQIDDQRAGATALVNGIALLADANNGGLRAASIEGITQLIGTGSIRVIICSVGNCYFSANQSNVSGALWVSDGTPSGTRAIAEFPDGALTVQAVVGDLIYAQLGGTNPGIVEVSTAGVVRVIYSGYSNGDLVANDQVVAFSTNADFGRMIRIDRGAAPVDLGRFVSHGVSKPAAVIGDTVIFAMETAAYGTELWRHRRGDAAPVLIRDFTPGPDSSRPDLITPFGDGVYLRISTTAFSLLPPFTDPVQESGLPSPRRFEVGQGRLAFEGGATGFSDAFLVPAFGSPAVALSQFSAGSFVPFEREVFGFLESGIVFGANATVTGPISSSLGREPYYADYSGGPAILLADLIPGSADSDPKAMSSDGQRAVFSAAERVWLVGAPLLGAQPLAAQPVPAIDLSALMLLALSILLGVRLFARND